MQEQSKTVKQLNKHQFTTFINDSPFVGQDISGLL